MLDPEEKACIRLMCKGFEASRLARVYDNFIKKSFEELVELAQAERRDMEANTTRTQEEIGTVVEQGSREAHCRAPPTPSLSVSVLADSATASSRGSKKLDNCELAIQVRPQILTM
jgi:hypothetical protein